MSWSYDVPSYPCRWPTCCTYVARRGDYCPAHADKGRQERAERNRYYDQHVRDADAKSFYNSAGWARARRTKLAHDPICQRCCRAWATTVHHRKPLKECTPAERLDQRNLMSLDAICHNILEARLGRTAAARRWIVCGPPASGKTTWVAEQRRPGDLVWDFDDVVQTVTGAERYVINPETIGLFEAMRDAMIGWLAAHPPTCDVFIIVMRVDRAKEIAAALAGEVIVMSATQQQCLDRLDAAERGPRREQQRASVAEWFTKAPIAAGIAG